MITGISIKNFRAFSDAVFEFGERVNIIVGPNGSGKTSLVEALSLLSSGKSFRGEDQELITSLEQWLRVDATTDKNERLVVKIMVDEQKNKAIKTFEKDGKQYKRFVPTLKTPVVLFDPSQLMIISGEPERRREYLDSILSITLAGYEDKLSRYKRILFQRNRLLKNPQAEQKQFFVWDVQLAELAVFISNKRRELVEQIDQNLINLYSKVAGSEDEVGISYIEKTTAPGEDILKLLTQKLPTDLERGFTSIGPHRDDVAITINQLEAKNIASRGEVRSLLLALKLNELKLVEETNNKKPILLLDDVFGELDARHRRSLSQAIKDYQSFITTTDADVVVDHFTNAYTKIIVINS